MRHLSSPSNLGKRRFLLISSCQKFQEKIAVVGTQFYARVYYPCSNYDKVMLSKFFWIRTYTQKYTFGVLHWSEIETVILMWLMWLRLDSWKLHNAGFVLYKIHWEANLRCCNIFSHPVFLQLLGIEGFFCPIALPVELSVLSRYIHNLQQ